MRCRRNPLPLGDSAHLPPRVLFHSRRGREQGWRWEPWGPAGRASTRLCRLFPQAGGGAAAENRLPWVGFLGEWHLERAFCVPLEEGAWGQLCQPAGSPSTAAETLASKADGEGDRPCPAALGALPPLAPRFASSWDGFHTWPVALHARAAACLCKDHCASPPSLKPGERTPELPGLQSLQRCGSAPAPPCSISARISAGEAGWDARSVPCRSCCSGVPVSLGNVRRAHSR